MLLDMKSIKLLEIAVFIFGSVVESLRLQNVIVPPLKMHNDTAVLECPFELGKERLYALKWYKDNDEFFRYVPRYKPHINVHAVEGVHVVKSESDQRVVTLAGLEARSTGIYRCEVSCEGPQFNSVSGEGRLTVVHLPKEGPQITGKVQDEYEVGDFLVLNCTSDPSFPAAVVTWFINDIPIENGRGAEPILPKNNSGALNALQLTSSVSTLNITLEPSHFTEDGEAKIRCMASISTLFWQDGSETIVGNTRNRHGAESRSTINLPPVFEDLREASLLVRGTGVGLRPNFWTLNLVTMILLLVFNVKQIFPFS